jgi:hypothetical protein
MRLSKEDENEIRQILRDCMAEPAWMQYHEQLTALGDQLPEAIEIARQFQELDAEGQQFVQQAMEEAKRLA